MIQADYSNFSAMLDAVCGLLSRGGYAPNPANTALFFRALQRHDIAVVRAAFDAHVADPTRGRFVPVPADLIAQIQGAAKDDGRPGPEEAWSMIPMSEAGSVVWTQEMAAAFGVALHLIENDRIAARMAFKEAYEREVRSARDRGEPVNWSPSLGHDPRTRDACLRDAIEKGRLTIERAVEFSPSLEAPVAKLRIANGSRL